MAGVFTTQLQPSITDAKLKAVRAKKHLDNLRGELRRFRKAKPHTVRTEHDVKNGRYLIHFKIRKVPPGITLIAGDFLTCTRAALDHLVWSLAKLTLPYPEGTQFPILDRDIASDKQIKNRFNKQLTGVPSDAVRIIESLQPYHGGNTAAIQSHLLWRLNLLCNIDKHRRIPVHGDESYFSFPHLPRSLGPHVKLVRRNVVSIPGASKRQVRLDPKSSFKVVFGDLSQGIACDFSGLEEIYKFVAGNVIPRFMRFFK